MRPIFGKTLRGGKTSPKSVLNTMRLTNVTVLSLAPIRLNAAYKGPCFTVDRTNDRVTKEIPYLPGMPNWDRFKYGMYNLLMNPDGRFGSMGWTAQCGSLGSLPGGFSVTGDGTSGALMRMWFGPAVSTRAFNGFLNRRHLFRAYVTRPVASVALSLITNTSAGEITTSLSSDVAAGSSGWVSCIVTETAAASADGVSIRVEATFSTMADQKDKVLGVQWASIVCLGDDTTNPMYSKTKATAIADLDKFSDGKSVKPFGTMAGEVDLASMSTFIGVSSGTIAKWWDSSGYGNHAVQATKGYQPRIFNTGLCEHGLLPYFDGTDDRLSIPNSDWLDIKSAPLTMWAMGINIAQNGFVISRGGADVNLMQYGLMVSVTGQPTVGINKTVHYGNPTVPLKKRTAFGGVWDGANVDSISAKTRANIAAKTGELTTYTNTFIGARSNSADGSSCAAFWKGNIGMILLADLNPDQAKLNILG